MDKKIKISIKILLVIICMATIFLLSNDNADKSTKKSDKLITFCYEKITKKKVDANIIDKYVHPVRKSAHFIIYLILGLTVISLLYEFNISTKNIIIFSILFCFIYACSDEIHQLFITGRSGEIKDVFIDTIGSTIGIFIYYFWRKKHGKQEKILT